ncbi:VOC family protein [Rothia sp. LK2588]|uniref:VOC family protein n=1 Tax=Rothia sp. LK2588 TaxID=3114369 RepID=UPI0034CDB97B
MTHATIAQPSSSESKLPAVTSMGAVRLRVRDVASVLTFYTDGVGLTVLTENSGEIMLGLRREGTGGRGEENVVLILEHDPSLRHPSRTEAGLFHVAILFDTKHDLALSLLSTMRRYQERYMGPGDHLVSQAFYFADPEGNGVELYWDRPREEWAWTNGQVQMDTLFIDAAQFIRANLTEEEVVRIAEGQAELDLLGTVGHVHLQVGDTATAREFYVKALGFDQTATLGNQALFVAAGGYHHHMAMNVWNSRGAGPREKTLGLGVINVDLPDDDSIARAADRLKFHGIQATFEGNSLRLSDPWNNLLVLRPAD